MNLAALFFMAVGALWISNLIFTFIRIRSIDKKIKTILSFSYQSNNSGMDILLLLKRIEEELSQIRHEVYELRLQIGIIHANVRDTIHVRETQVKIPYTGAKRGPKPKNQVQE